MTRNASALASPVRCFQGCPKILNSRQGVNVGGGAGSLRGQGPDFGRSQTGSDHREEVREAVLSVGSEVPEVFQALSYDLLFFRRVPLAHTHS
jgi:hypothetical protein